MEKSNLVLKDITFPVVKAPVFTLLKGKTDEFVRIPGKTALLNSISNHPLSVVSSDYELITNEQAYEYGEKCMRTLFGMDKNSKIELFNIISPKSRSFCHIDLFADNKDLEFHADDKYTPFVRVTNSYNAMFRLSFNVGFCRWICKNGVIFGEQSIKFKFSHTKGFKKEINFEIHKNGFDALLNKFRIDVEILQKFSLPEEYLFPMFCKALCLNMDLSGKGEDEKIKKLEKLHKTKLFFENIISKYKNELGNNCYALYNAVTEIATFGFEEENLYVTRVNSRQRRAGIWLSEISELLRNGEINYEDYLKNYLQLSRN